MVMIIPDAPPDAPPDAAEPTFDFSCMGNTQGAAAANVTLSGFAAEIVISGGGQPDIQPSHSATIDVCKASSITCTNTDQLDTQTTPMMGCPATGCPFTSDMLATGGTALDVYAKASKTGLRTTYIYPAAPVIANVPNVPAAMFSPAVIAFLDGIGIIMQTDGNAIMLVAITDCANMPISDTANTTIVLKQDGAVVAGTTQLDLSQAAPALAGTYAIFNVPAGPAAGNDPSKVTEVSGTYKTKALRAHEVRVFRDATTATQLRPGF